MTRVPTQTVTIVLVVETSGRVTVFLGAGIPSFRRPVLVSAVEGKVSNVAIAVGGGVIAIFSRTRGVS